MGDYLIRIRQTPSTVRTQSHQRYGAAYNAALDAVSGRTQVGSRVTVWNAGTRGWLCTLERIDETTVAYRGRKPEHRGQIDLLPGLRAVNAEQHRIADARAAGVAVDEHRSHLIDDLANRMHQRQARDAAGSVADAHPRDIAER